MSFLSYATVVTATVLLSCALVFLAGGALPEGSLPAFAFGAAVAGLNALASMGLLEWTRGRSHVAFMRALLGGMVGRLAAMLGGVAFGLLALDLPRTPLLIGLLGHFVLFLALELGIVHRGFKPAGAR
ncbi:MAG TPA: hypothetical protein VFM88_03210 [Vicinamibacteria bacterium]|nr:hypothetical protein [Vicinamibacteria bacterium]